MAMYKYWNEQMYSECQLVTIWNAALFHGISVPEQFGDEYKTACEKCCCTIGACINTTSVSENLGLISVDGLLEFEWVKNNLPVEFSIYCHRGHHSVLCVDINIENEQVLITNYFKGMETWLPFEGIKQLSKNDKCPKSWKVK